jgi:electron transfer flavoprotein alpha subunit
MAGVLVFGDMAGGKLAAASLEIAAAGAALADALGQPLLGALIGEDLAADSEQFGGGFSSLYLVEGKHYRRYTAHACICAAQAVIKACSPSVALFPHTLETREWVPRLAARLDTGLVMDCTVLAAEGNELVATKPTYGGGVLGEFVIRGTPRMATIRAGAYGPRSAMPGGEVVRLDVPAPEQVRVTVLDEAAAAAASGPKLKDAKIVVSGGRGLGARDNWHFIEETAAALGAAVGCSRPVADSGWVSTSYQVGLSGICVTSDLYIAVGISGAVQHLAGISAARTVVAINVDPEADIFTRANYGVVGDYREVLPAFIERVKQLRS